MDSQIQRHSEGTGGPVSPRSVFVVDDHPLVREGLAKLIAQYSDLFVCGEAEDIENAYSGILAAKPDVVVLDLTLKGQSGFDLIERIRGLPNPPPILVLSMHDTLSHVERAIRSGALGYVVKSELSRNVIGALRKVLMGEHYVSQKVSHGEQEGPPMRDAMAAFAVVTKLSQRELDVFSRIGLGMENRRIGEELHISLKTVQTHCHHVKRKLRLENGTLLLRDAVRWVETLKREGEATGHPAVATPARDSQSNINA